MDKSIFRKESIDRVSSPEQLNQYIRVTNPSIWVILSAIIFLLLGMLSWSVFGTLETVISAKAVCKNGVSTCYIADAADVRPGMPAEIGGKEGIVKEVSASPLSYATVSAELADEYALFEIAPSEWSYKVTVETADVPDGVHSAKIITDRVNPIFFVLN